MCLFISTQRSLNASVSPLRKALRFKHTNMLVHRMIHRMAYMYTRYVNNFRLLSNSHVYCCTTTF